MNILYKKYFFICCYLFAGVQLSVSQNEAKKWYFGYNAALDFMPGAPVNVLGSSLSHIEGSSSIADASGNLLFYTDGITVWDRNHNPMPNGAGLLGGISSTQAALIVKQPGNTNIYYVFTTGSWGTGPSNYSIVDITLNGGLGDVTIKNTQMLANCSEKIAATKHCNGTDIWIVNHERAGTIYHSFLLTATGLNASVQSAVGQSYLSNLGYIGQLKFSPNGTKLGAAINSSTYELYDFNKTTGAISNPIVLATNINAPYGVEFSQDNSKFYGYNTDIPGAVTTLRQWDICAGNAAAIIASATIVATPAVMEAGALQLATDGKIYVAKFSNILGVINNPNATGLACTYVNNGISVAPNSSADGLPNFVSSYFDLNMPLATPSQINTTACQNNGSATAAIINGCSGPYTYTWSNNIVTGPTAATSDSIINLAVGNYNVIITDASCKKDTLYFTITGISNIQTTQNPVICVGNTFMLPDSSIVSISGTYVDTLVSFNGCDSIITTNLTVTTNVSISQNFIICNGDSVMLPDSSFTSISGTYIDTVSSITGCDSIITSVINIKPNSATTQNPIICSNNTFQLPDNSFVNTTGIYIDTVASFNGCDSIVTTTLTVNPIPIITISPNIIITSGQSATLTATGGNTYTWSPSAGLNNTSGNTVLATPSQTTTYCVIVTNNNNGCSDTACTTVSIETPCTSNENLQIPNAFSPNGDNVNDDFCLKGWDNCLEDFKILIYNRWGEKIFESKDPNFCWDGRYKETTMDAQVLIYYLKAKYSVGHKSIVKKGNISLIR